MSDRTQDLKNLRAVATACKNYVDETKEQILWQVGQYNITTQDDNTTAYQKVVPTGATRVKIKSIGFMSYKSENLLYNLGSTATTNGITFTIDNGNINVNGTPTSSYAGRYFNSYFPNNSLVGTYTLKNYTNDFPSGCFVRLTFIKDGNRVYSFSISQSRQSTTYTFDGTETGFTLEYAFQNPELTAQNGNIKPMVVKGSTTPTEFQPYFENIRDSAVTSIKSYGANILNSNLPIESQPNCSLVYSNEKYTYSTTSNSNCLSFIEFTFKANTNYTLSMQNITGDTNIKIALIDTNKSTWLTAYNSQSVSFSFNTDKTCYITVFNITSTGTSVFNIMLNYGSTAIPYKAYRGLIDTFTIPDEVKALDGYGRGISESIYNYIDLITSKTISGVDTTKSYVKNVGKQQNITIVSLSGLSNEVNSFFSFEKPTGMNATDSVYSRNYLCNKYNVVQHQQDLTNASLQNKIISNISSSNNYLCLPAGATIEQAQTAINDVYLYYKLETQVETDISQYIDNNVIEVEAGGYLVFENQYGQAVPSNITYRIEVAR